MKAQALLGHSIVTFDRGRTVGRVRDVVFDVEAHQLLGVVVDEPGVFARAKVVPMDEICQIGPDVVFVASARAVKEARQCPGLAQSIARRRTLKGVRVLSEDGRDLGRVSDVEIDGSTGRVSEYVVSGGVLADAYSGTSRLPAEQVMMVGRDVAIVPTEAVEMLEQQVGGVKGALQDARPSSRAKHVARDARERAGEFAETAEQKVRKAWSEAEPKLERLRDRVMRWVRNRRIKAALGRPVSRVIYSKDDDVILHYGDLVTHAALERARAEGVLDMVLSSVARRPAGRFNFSEI